LNRLPLLLSFLCAIPLSNAVSASETDSLTRFQPHEYLGDRGTEPRFQAVVTTNQKWSGTDWLLQSHFEAETLGRHDLSLDLDRAWFRTGDWTLGRIHPWELLGDPEAQRPWGYAAQSQPQNKGILLGPSPERAVFPDPVLLGWVGAHWTLNERAASGLAFSASATPIFVPSLGSEVKLTDDADASATRFGRRPPGSVRVGSADLPLRYRIDTSRILQDVLFQPQLMIQARLSAPAHGYRAWLSLQRAPRPDAEPDASGYVNVATDPVTAVAEVRPRFPELWSLTTTHVWSGLGPDFFASAQASGGGAFGYEVGARLSALSVSFLDELRTGASSTGSAGFSDARYSDRLAQAELTLSAGQWQWYGGAKVHLTQDGAWLRSGIGWLATRELRLDLGGDVFGGGDSAWFGEWRTNDRIFLNLTWRSRS
jgi:hypothetical protein